MSMMLEYLASFWLWISVVPVPFMMIIVSASASAIPHVVVPIINPGVLARQTTAATGV